jgi:hypothetical protein
MPASEDRLSLVETVRLDMRRYGPGFVRAEFACGTLLAAAPTVAILVALMRRPATLAGWLLLLGAGLICAGWCLNGLTLLAIACRQCVKRDPPGDMVGSHRALQRLVRLALPPGSLPLALLRERRVARA